MPKNGLRKELTTQLEWATYNAWTSLRQRCLNPKHRNYHHYGGRGIRVCSRWDIFDNFLSDLGIKPTIKHTLERINVNGNYEPTNCKWIINTEQARNRRNRNWRSENRITTPKA